MRFYALSLRPWIEDDPGSGGGHWGLPPGTIGSVDLGPVGAQGPVFITGLTQFAPRDVEARFGDGTTLDNYVPPERERDAWAALTGVTIEPGWTLLDALWHTLTDRADPDGVTRAMPIMPTHKGVLDLHLGGHSLLRAEKLPEDPTAHLAWPAMQRVFRKNYRAISERDETLARKWLGAQAIKLRLADEDASALLIDEDLERLAPIRPTTEISDDFNRADQDDLGTSAEGWSWETVTGTTSIESNEARLAASTSARAEIDLSSDDHRAEAEYRSAASGFGREGPACRFHSGADTHYAAAWQGQNGSFRLARVEAGSITVISTDTISVVAGDILAVVADGSTISKEHNGTTVGSPVTDTNITGHLRTGFSRVQGGGANVWLDNFAAADLVAEGADLVRSLSEALGVGEAPLRSRARMRAQDEGVGLGHAVQRLRDMARRRDEAVAATETSMVARALVRLRAEAMAITQAVVTVVEEVIEAIVRVVAEAVGVGEAVARTRRLARIRGEMVGVLSAVVRLGGTLHTAVPAAIADRTRMAVGAARRLIVRGASRFNVPPVRRM